MSTIVEASGPAAAVDAPIDPALMGNGKLGRGGVSWSLFEGARNPYVILITIYIFIPYVAATMVGDPVRGQEIVSRWSQYSGWFIMATAPFLGASIDRLGRRKTWLGLATILMIPMMATLWWAKPDGTGISVLTVMILTTLIGILFTYTEVLHNSLLVRAAGISAAHKASGLALALGNGMAVLALAFTAWAFALPGSGLPFVPEAPLFGLDPAQNEPSRIVAPMAALIFAVGAIPLFLFTPDAKPTGIPIFRALADGARDLKRMILGMKNHRDAAIFLVSRMFYVDGKPLEYVAETLDPQRIREAGYFDPVAVGRLFEKCRQGRITGFADNQAFVGILSTMLLHQNVTAGTARQADNAASAATSQG